MEERIRSVLERDALGDESRLGAAFLAHRKIHQIAEVGMRILRVVGAVMRACRVEMPAG